MKAKHSVSVGVACLLLLSVTKGWCAEPPSGTTSLIAPVAPKVLPVLSLTPAQLRIAQAALAGDAQAQSDVGMMFYRGDGLPKNDIQAFNWFRMSSDQGAADGQYNLGMMYLKGIGVEKNEAEALKLFTSAALKGESEAQFMLGVINTVGSDGQSSDEVRSVAWMKLSAEGGSEAGKALFSLMDASISDETRQQADLEVQSLMSQINTGLPQPKPLSVESIP